MVDPVNPNKFPPPPPGGLKVPPLPPKAPGSVKMPPAPPRPGMTPPPAARPAFLPPAQNPADSSASREMEERLRRMEEQSREMEDSKKKLERALADMETKLKDEKEKALTQTIKAREEESLSLKMEQALKEMQEKARRDRREQELEETRSRAEEKVKDLERRLNEEREAWVINLKKQMEVRDSDTRQVESQIEARFRDLERRWHDEKGLLTQTLKSKEDEIAQLKSSLPEAQSQMRRVHEEAQQSIELARRKFEQDIHAFQEESLREKRSLGEKLDLRERELVSLKAQLSMIDAQVRAAQEASQKQIQEKERNWQFQLSDLQKDFMALQQAKEQLQADLARTGSEAAALRKDLGEWEKKNNAAEQRIQELRFQLAQSETRSQDTILKLQSEVRRAEMEKESIEKNYLSERQNWTTRLEEKIMTEKGLREALARKENEVLAFRHEMEVQIVKSRAGGEAERNRLQQEYQEQLAKKQAELEALRGEAQALAQRQRAEFEAERAALERDFKERLARKDQEIAELASETGADAQKLRAGFEAEKARLLQERDAVLARKDADIAALKSGFEAEKDRHAHERETLEQKLRKQFDEDRNVLVLRHQEELARRDKLAAELKLELQSVEQRLKQQFSEEKQVLLQWAEQQAGEEVAAKAEIMQRELAQIRSLMLEELESLEKQIQADQSRYEGLLQHKEAELSDALSSVEDMHRELVEQKTSFDAEFKALQARMEQERRETQIKQLKERELYDLELQKQSLAFEKRLEEEKARLKEDQEKVRRELQDRVVLLGRSQEELIREKETLEKNLGAAPASASLPSKIWKYLNRTVVVLNLRAVPRIRK